MNATDHERAIAALDEMLANNQRTIDNLRAILAADGAGEPMATVELMTVGGWMQRPGRARWLQITAITPCGVVGDRPCWRIDLRQDPDGGFVHVDPAVAYPFLTAEQFDRDCAQEQEDAATDVLHHAEFMAERANPEGQAA